MIILFILRRGTRGYIDELKNKYIQYIYLEDYSIKKRNISE